MINIAQVKYDTAVLLPQGERLSLPNVANSLSWSEQSGELAASLQFRILNQRLGDGWLHQKLPLGARTLLRADWGEGWQEIHQGIVFDWEYENDSVGVLNVKAYDILIYLLRSKDDRYYPNGTKARVIVEDIAKAWNIPIGQNDLPDMALSKQVFRGDTLGAMLGKVLEQVQKRGGGKYVIRASGGKINVLRQGQNETVYRFEGEIVRRMTDKQDIEDLVTRVKIIGKEDKAWRAPVVATLDGKTEFGILQDVIYNEQYDTAAAAKAAAQEILNERGAPRKRRTIAAPDLPFLRRGDKIFASVGTIEGHFAVVGIQHDADTHSMTMEVETI
ncbi:XkdQ/YqbQ family protein [Paenibacillus popilliae]|uniref:YqbQ/XkdQ domain-containing protein n=2 Tax=Paenibacillus popilliae TaxID=78057 RepID=M9M2A3_PAEPP|nr:hypothetical protein [Paenibacillus popilliae]GAC41253.1 hypothetical protein PPOP_0603 [Paenibacillus popilliae ATCC 14706]